MPENIGADDVDELPGPGSIVWVDWRDRHFRGEPGSIRPSIVVNGKRLLRSDFDILTVVPMTGDKRIAILALSLLIQPNDGNGFTKPSFALAFNVQSIALRRIVRLTVNAVEPAELAEIRSRIAEWLGFASSQRLS